MVFLFLVFFSLFPSLFPFFQIYPHAAIHSKYKTLQQPATHQHRHSTGQRQDKDDILPADTANVLLQAMIHHFIIALH